MSRYARATALLAAVVAIGCVSIGNVRADVVITVNKSTQRMSVSVDGENRYNWAVSTGVHGTPSGTFRPQWLSRNHRSSLFNNAPMPYSIFYDGNYAIHGTNQISRLGGRASHGCIRLHPSNAAVLFALVQKEGTRQHPGPNSLGSCAVRHDAHVDNEFSARRAACGSLPPCGPSANAPPPIAAPMRVRPAGRPCAMTRD